MFSKSLLTAFVAGLAAFAQAQDLFDPTSNPTITPAIGEAVPAGKPYTLTWTPTTKGPVNIELIAGATQAGLTSAGFVAQGIANTGSVSWTPTNDIAAFAVVGYKVIDAATGKFQYSVPFKVTKGAEPTTSTTSTGSSTSTSTSATGYPTYTPPAPTYAPTTKPTSTYVPTTIVPTYTPKPSGSAPGYNSTIVYPTGSLTVPTTLYPTGTAKPSEFPGAASVREAGLGLAGVVAGLVLLL